MTTDRTRNSPILVLPLLAVSLSFNLPAGAQRDSDPNLGHYYMARQQWSYTDDSPVVTNKKNPPPQPGAAPGAGSLPAGLPQGLPAAKWSQYAPIDTPPSLSSSLPKVSNGVPKAPPPGPPGAKGKAGKLPAGGKSKPATAPAVDKSTPAAYSEYKKFSPEAAVSGANQSNGNVKGDVLHWARRGQAGRL